MCGCVHVCVHTWRSETTYWVFFFYLVGSRDLSQVDGKYFHLLSHILGQDSSLKHRLVWDSLCRLTNL